MSDTLQKEQWKAKLPPRQVEIDLIYQQMQDTINIFDKAGINYHLVAGSALGLARNGGLIPWDDDVDFGIHVSDKDKLWALRNAFNAKGYGIVWADIGFKTGTGDLIEDTLQNVEGRQTVVGGQTPFTGVNQDIFFFEEQGEQDGVPVLRYSSARALNTWPKEVIPVSGWYSPVVASFGGYTVKAMPADNTDWYLRTSYGAQWKTHDGQGNEIKTLTCALHSSHMQQEDGSVAAGHDPDSSSNDRLRCELSRCAGSKAQGQGSDRSQRAWAAIGCGR